MQSSRSLSVSVVGDPRFRQLADAMPQMVWLARGDGYHEYFNRGWYEYTGATAEESLGDGWLQVFHSEDQADIARGWEQACACATPFEGKHRIRRAGDGLYRWHLGRALPQLDEAGAVHYWIGTFTDIHETRMQEQALRDSQKALLRYSEELEQRVLERTAELRTINQRLEISNRELQDFASVASHDLQEPLRKIQAFGDRLALRVGPTLGPEGEDYLHRMKNAAGRMQRLISDLLAFSRVTTQAHEFVSVDLNQIAAEVVNDLESAIEKSGGRVEVSNLPRIDADPMQMRQLLQNLIGNALKFRGPQIEPRVRVRAMPTTLPDIGDACEIRVEDNGIGFDEKYLDRIFNVFQRLHGRNTYEGTGIGLAVCRKIAERHGGSITAQSKPGEGSTFIVTLPMRQAPAGATSNYEEINAQ